jgi:hypothetical protein
MLTDRIQEKLRELSTLPGVKSIGLGKKIIGGTQTDTVGITFGVTIKEANPENMLPTSVDIDGVTYVTDVVEIGEVSFAACPATPTGTTQEKYVVSGMSYINRFFYNSSSFDSGEQGIYIGTFGFVAYHPDKNILVGVTAAHLLYDPSEPSTVNKQAVGNKFYVDISANGYINFNYPVVAESYFINGQITSINIQGSYIGAVLSYVPLKVKPENDPNRFNQVDACLSYFVTSQTYTCVIPDFVGSAPALELDPFYDPSWRSYQVKGIPEITSPMPFATTAELNALVSSPPSQVSSTGVGTGTKHGFECGLKIDAVGVTTSLTSDTIPGEVYFDNLISFSRITPGLPTVLAGDSGAALIAKIGGIWKIIGLVIGGNETVGYASRIDKLAEQLGIEAWDGSVKPLGSIVTSYFGYTVPSIVTPGINDAQQIVIDGRIYYQAGVTTLSAIGYYE